MKTWSWSDLGRSWGGLGRSWGDLGWSWGGLWGVLGRLGAVLGGSWSLLGRPKIDQKIDPKLDSKTGRIATEKMAQTLRLSMFQSLRGLSATQITSPKKAIKTAIDMISSY